MYITYIYIYIHRERERERDLVYTYVCIESAKWPAGRPTGTRGDGPSHSCGGGVAGSTMLRCAILYYTIM